MTDKDIKDYCKNCSVEPPAMRFKCPECEHNPDRETNELHLIIDRLLEASGYDKNISTAEDFEYVYADINYKLGLLDDLKQECEALKSKIHDLRQLRELDREARVQFYNQVCEYRKALKDIEEIVKINCEEICGRKFEDCNDFLCSSKNILDIINKAKEG